MPFGEEGGMTCTTWISALDDGAGARACRASLRIEIERIADTSASVKGFGCRPDE
jgi:hypothetical protein